MGACVTSMASTTTSWPSATFAPTSTASFPSRRVYCSTAVDAITSEYATPQDREISENAHDCVATVRSFKPEVSERDGQEQDNGTVRRMDRPGGGDAGGGHGDGVRAH